MPPPRSGPGQAAAVDAPLRATPLSAAQLAVHGRQLASQHQPAGSAPARALLAPLDGHLEAIARACDAFDDARRAGYALPPAAIRLLDHYHLLDAQVRLARGQLLIDERALPRLAPDGEPRACRLMAEAVASGDGRVDPDQLSRFLAAYQEGAALTLAELDLVPALLRLTLVDNLRRLAARALRACTERRQAAGWAGRMLETAEQRPGDLILLVADMARSVQPLGKAFVAELARRLQGQGGALAQALDWVDARLADEGSSIAQQLQAERSEQADDAVSAANSLASLRTSGGVDWRAFAEGIGAVEQVLRADPDGSYARMDGPTRDLYRRAVGRLSEASGHGETEVAQEAVALAGVHLAPGEGGLDRRTRHVGHYLVGPGREVLEQRLRGKPGLVGRLGRAVRRAPLAARIAAIGLFTLLFAVSLGIHARQGGAGPYLAAAIGLLAACGASQLARSLVRMMEGWLAPRAPTPRLDFTAGIPASAQAVVAVSGRLLDAATVAALCRDLEVRYLGNRDPKLRFCLLADLADAASEQTPDDAALVEQARAAIEALNRKHGREQVVETYDEMGQPDAATVRVEPFVLLVRCRSWSPSEQAWLGRGRRRGALADLNAYLCGGARERFLLAAGATAGLAEVRYVIALDAATALGRDSARQLVAAMAHPLNQPILAKDGRVLEGHGMLLPRACASLPGPRASRYERWWLDGAGTWAAPDAGCGAGDDDGHHWAAIYDVDAWQRALGEAADDECFVPGLPEEDRLRAWRVADVCLDDGHPSSYAEHALRRNCDTRAHWQIANRLGRSKAPPLLSINARWHLFDRLRASLAAPTMLALLIVCWSMLAAPVFWSAAVLSVYFLPALAGSLAALAGRPHDAPLRQHLDGWLRGARVPLVRAALSAALLPHVAWCQLDAIAKALWRRKLSRRRLLEWQPAAQAGRGAAIADAWRRMWCAPLIAVGTAVLLTFANPYALFAAAPLLLVWFLSPVLAWWSGLPARQRAERLTAAQARELGALARRTWAFFEDHAPAGARCIAPEAVLEHPQPALDGRISASSIGYSLLAALAARDFGFIPAGALLERSAAALSAMELLESWRGHLFDWYDGATLAPVEPAHVSTAGSGSLLLSLRILAAGLDELPCQPAADGRALDGIRATLDVLAQLAAEGSAEARDTVAAVARALEPERWRALDTLPGLADCLRSCARESARLAERLADQPEAPPALLAWAGRLAAQCETQLQDLYAVAPWMRAVDEYVIDARLTRIPTLRELAAFDVSDMAGGLARMVEEGRDRARRRIVRGAQLAQQARELARMDLRALYDEVTGLLATGYQVREGRMDEDSCDLLASEARMASFAAVADGQLAQQHWWSLGRPVRMEDGEALLLSRCGALSDYLAPQLLMPAWRDTLLDGAARAQVRVQAALARAKGRLWGYSESLCNAVDADARYRASRFGAPAAALQRRDDDDLAAAPYAAMLALPVLPSLAAANLEQAAGQGLLGEYGLYEALDYAPQRLPQGERQVVVRAWVGRHQAMGMLALAQVLLDAPMQRRFLADPAFCAALPLLQETPPASGASAPPRYGALPAQSGTLDARAYARVIAQNGQDEPELPEIQLLSNGSYHLLVASDGAGSSRWEEHAITRDRPGEAALACYVRDTASGQLWSNTLLPTLTRPERQEAVFAEGRVSFRRHDHGIEMLTEVVVAPEDDIELHRIRLANHGSQARTLELTSYIELAAPAGARVEVFFDEAGEALMCATSPQAPLALHLMSVRGQEGRPSCETSRARFVARGHDLRAPQAVLAGGALQGVQAQPDEPVLALRRSVSLDPGAQVTVDLALGVAGGLAAARELALRYRAGKAVDHAIEAAWTHGQAFLRRNGVSEAQAQLYTRLASCLLYPTPALRSDAAVIARNVRSREHLAPYGITGELPVLLLQLGQGADSDLASQVMQAHAYWRNRGFAADLLVLCDGKAAREQAMHLAAPVLDPSAFEQPGGVHVHLVHDIPQEDRILLRSIARVVLFDGRGALADQLRRAARTRASLPPALAPAADAPPWTSDAAPVKAEGLLHDNGIGGFAAGGAEYVVRSGPGLPVPAAPWVNLLANEAFGSVVAENGHVTSWSGDHGARVSAGHEDGLAPRRGEAFYLRDEDTGRYWSPTPWPAPSGAACLTRHGFGYTRFEQLAQGIRSDLLTFVPLDAALRYSRLKLKNESSAPRRLSVTGYVDWMLDESGAPPGLQVVTGIDLASGALLARNAFGAGLREKVAFFHLDAEQVSATGDRAEFAGPHGSLARPAALERAGLSGQVGAGLDPCAALQTKLELQPGEECELVFVLGVAGPGSLDASRAVQRHGGAQAAAAAWERLRGWWDQTLGAIEAETPDAALNLLANGWLLYQAICCAMGEREPARRLQSLLPALHVRPELLRAELLRAAREFAAGEPAAGDFLWLPYALARYLAATGDQAVLSELPAEQGGGARDTLYQHCVHGMRGALRFGARGLPLAGVRLHEDLQAIEGRSESVRLAFFMTEVLQRFAEVADKRGDFGFSTTCRGAALALAAQTEQHGWDGEWYRWAFLADGTALGAAASPACRIDLPTQGWAVLGGAARGERALRAAGERLLRQEEGIALQAEPPVDGQWAAGLDTCAGQDHRATAWAGIGFARIGDAARAWQLARMLDPLARTSSLDAAGRYAAAPYFLTDGVRTIAPHAGRAIGGCYTGSAAWTWLLLVEALLGIERAGARLLLRPRVPPEWQGFRLRYRYRRTIYEIAVRAGEHDALLLDGEAQAELAITLVDDSRLHRVEVQVARSAPAPARAGHADNNDPRTTT